MQEIVGTSENAVKNRFYCLLRSFVNSTNQQINNNNLYFDRNKILELNVIDKFFNATADISFKPLQDNNTESTIIPKGKINLNLEELSKYIPGLLKKYNIEYTIPNDTSQLQQMSTVIPNLDKPMSYGSYTYKFEEDKKFNLENTLSFMDSGSIRDNIFDMSNADNFSNYDLFGNEESNRMNFEYEKIQEVTKYEKIEKPKHYKSSILLDMQLNQIGKVLDKFNIIIMHKFFESFKTKTIGNNENIECK